MERADWHIFQVLTKRHERLAALGGELRWPENVWMGVSVENQDYVARIDSLRKVPAKVRFLSVEPLLGPIPFLPLKGIPLGHRWRRVWASCTTDAGWLGMCDPRQVPSEGRAFLFQAVGRRSQGKLGPPA